ncbi:MAG: hypothetical protein NTW87_23070 [Planctomycetota bacterium]|nr:hypothetical protein [Planctomycetota bacterium]
MPGPGKVGPGGARAGGPDSPGATAWGCPGDGGTGGNADGERAKKEAKKRELAVWQRISGLQPETEGTMTRSERRHALRKLFKHYERLVREALAEHEADPEKEERTFLWDPVAMICGELGIARRKLSALTKELTGMAAHEVVDKIRAEAIEAKMETELAAIFERRIYGGRPFRQDSYYHGWKWTKILWDMLKDSRKAPHFALAHWAARLGFANYARFRRGVMLAHGGLTPVQLEGRVLQRFAGYYELAEDVGYRRRALGDMYAGQRILEAGQPYTDRWAQAMKERPEWVAAMKAKLGFDEELEELSRAVNKPPLTEREAAIKARAKEIEKAQRRE